MTTTIDRIDRIPNAITTTPDATARAIWTMIAEPGDHGIGALIAAEGAEQALRHVLYGDDDSVDGIDIRLIRARTQARVSAETVEAAFQAAVRVVAALLTPEHPHWPAGLNDLGHGAPYALWVRGDTEALSATGSIALVGARAATGYGEHVTKEMASELVERGRSIVSGAAYGIDGMAHRAAIASGGRTVAYLAGGIDRPYPSGHADLIRRITDTGAVAAEVACGAVPTKWRFLSRNRLIAAGSRATVVIEAGSRSGSLNTASHAIDVGRPVGAVPGPITSAASAGCHRLIREFGATLVTTAHEADEL